MHELICSEGLDTFYDLQTAVGRPVGDLASAESAWAWASALQATTEATELETCQLRLRLDGMSCLGCIWLVEHLFNRLPGSRRIRVSLEARSLDVVWERGAFDLVGFLRLLSSFGYHASAFKAGPVAGWSPLTWRLVLCGLFVVNSGLLALPGYLMERAEATAGLFQLLGLLFAILAILVGGSHFIVPALRSMRAGIVHYDLSIALGLLYFALFEWQAAFLGAAQDARLWRLPLVVFLLLLARWLQVRFRPASADGSAVTRLEVAGARSQFWIQVYIYSALALVLAGSVVAIYEQSDWRLEVIVAALWAGALYPIARGVHFSGRVALLVIGLVLATMGLLFTFFGLLGPVTAALWLLLSGLAWQGLCWFTVHDSKG